MVLKLNTKLFGSSFTVERHKENGSIETKTVTEQCYLVGETESLHSSVAISDCDGLVRGFCVDPYPRVRVSVCVISRAKRLIGLTIYQTCLVRSPSSRMQHISAAELKADSGQTDLALKG